MRCRLLKVEEVNKDDLVKMIDEWQKDQAENHTNHSPWAIFKNDIHDFEYYKKNLEIKEEREGRVPDSVFFCVDEERNRIVGAVNIRHYLNEGLLVTGGHIGDGVRPSERRKGYATEIIRLALIECKKLGIDKVLITCDKYNEGSRKSIVKNGGVLENEVEEDGGITQRYWIDNCQGNN